MWRVTNYWELPSRDNSYAFLLIMSSFLIYIFIQLDLSPFSNHYYLFYKKQKGGYSQLQTVPITVQNNFILIVMKSRSLYGETRTIPSLTELNSYLINYSTAMLTNLFHLSFLCTWVQTQKLVSDRRALNFYLISNFSMAFFFFCILWLFLNTKNTSDTKNHNLSYLARRTQQLCLAFLKWQVSNLNS